MPRNSYQERLRDLRGKVTAIGDRALDQYESAVEVLQSGDPVAAQSVIEGDDALNDWYLDLESECIDLIALQQPVASDLRFVASSFKILTDIERIGDVATNIAAHGRDSGGDLDASERIERIATAAGEMVEGALDAYARDDTAKARAIAQRDDDLDRQCKEAGNAVVRGLLAAEYGTDTRLDDVSHTLLTIRDIERVGDHAVNICGRTVYMIEHDDELLR
jgi:phosphate transport system protein